jgi:hypothetical protein
MREWQTTTNEEMVEQWYKNSNQMFAHLEIWTSTELNKMVLIETLEWNKTIYREFILNTKKELAWTLNKKS